jgi:hypothetical protein
MELSSTAFSNGGAIPRRFGYGEDNVSPPLEIGGVPDGTESLALVIDDPDAMEPAGRVWDHWVVWNIPPGTRRIPEGSLPEEAEEGTTDYGETGYGGPNPPDREHTYRFRLYALDTRLDLPASARKADLEKTMNGHVLERADLSGTYAP